MLNCGRNEVYMSHMREIQFRTKLTFKTKSRLSKHEKLLDCIRSYFLYNSIQSSNELSEYSQRKRKAKFLGYSMYCTSIIMEYNTVWLSTAEFCAQMHAGPLVLKVTLCCLHPKEEVTAPAFFNIKDFFRSVLFALSYCWGKPSGANPWI